jgi:hypothetical protein
MQLAADLARNSASPGQFTRRGCST